MPHMVPFLICVSLAITWCFVQYLRRPLRPYKGAKSVGSEYDKWTTDKILETYWGDHIHLGWYSNPLNKSFSCAFHVFKILVLRGIMGLWSGKKEFIEAKVEFVDRLVSVSMSKTDRVSVGRILDVGCGVGGTTRMLARAFPAAKVVGVSISPKQVERARELSAGIDNVSFCCGDAMDLQSCVGSTQKFDLVWSCESMEHMPDKKAFLQSMRSVAADHSRLVVATWCQKNSNELSNGDKDELKYLYDDWCHPYFLSCSEYAELARDVGFSSVRKYDWTRETLDSWADSIVVGVYNPFPVILAGPRVWLRVLKEIYTISRMHRAFASGLMHYGILTATG